MTARRDFMKVLSAAAVRPACGLAQARDLVRSGVLGPVRFCRIGDPAMRAEVRAILPPAMRDCIIEVNRAADGAALLGTRATLVIAAGACRVWRSAAL